MIPGGGAIDPNFQQIEALAVQHKVDLFAWGHVHNAFASCPVYNGTCVTPSSPGEYDAPIHVCIGNAGMDVTSINTQTKPSWVQWQSSTWGYSTLNVSDARGPEQTEYHTNDPRVDLSARRRSTFVSLQVNATHLKMSFFLDSDNSLQHTFTIVRNWPRSY